MPFTNSVLNYFMGNYRRFKGYRSAFLNFLTLAEITNNKY